MTLLERIAEHLSQLPPHFRAGTAAQLLAAAAIELKGNAKPQQEKPKP